jgi:hypothetical protein
LRHLVPRVEFAADLAGLAAGQLQVAQPVERSALGHGGEPGGGVVRHAGLAPLLQGADQRVLRQFLGQFH